MKKLTTLLILVIMTLISCQNSTYPIGMPRPAQTDYRNYLCNKNHG
jgi:hypothetical protein